VNADDRRYFLVAKLLSDGKVVPFRGVGANLCDGPQKAAREPGRFATSGRELGRALAERSRYPDDSERLRILRYVDAILSERKRYRYFCAVFDAEYRPSALHRLLARLPALLREPGREQLIVLATNYDDLVKRQNQQAGCRADATLLAYAARSAAIGGAAGPACAGLASGQ
jgi:hypothetical protein